ncbi:MAG: radical SAM protein [Candidatus Marinimicrobia bacterium]|nr:radical SAM protein [bacterium]MCG2714664.1 radical SAM protein [Candidatus Neomarinimicrobiota bacterium]
MKVLAKAGREDIAVVYIAEMRGGKFVEFVESLQPPLPREKKWVLIISTLYGCPVGCRFCDAGVDYQGKLSKDEIISQIDYLVTKRFPNRKVPVEKFKIQFARMGEPSFNQSVLDVLDSLPDFYDTSRLMPCISTIAPRRVDRFFERLLEIKKMHYKYRFQLQFSIHTTDEELRDWLIPVQKWDFEKIAEYGETFYDKDGRKITLNFSLADKMSIDLDVLLKHFSPDIFLIKITPVNPTYQANKNGLSSTLTSKKWNKMVDTLRSSGYEVILSVGELEENYIGSNCGQYVTTYQREKKIIEDAYTYELQRH